MKLAMQTMLFINSNKQTVIPRKQLLDLFTGKSGLTEFALQQGYLVSTEKITGTILDITHVDIDEHGLIDKSLIKQQMIDMLNSSEEMKDNPLGTSHINKEVEIAVGEQISAFENWKNNPNKINTGKLVRNTVVVGELLLPLLRQQLDL